MQKILILFETIKIYLKIIITNKTIILGPYHGEFGFEVSMNASIAYSIKKKFRNKLIVVSLDGNKALYNYCDKFIVFNYNLKNAGYGYGNYIDSLSLRNEFKRRNKFNENIIYIDLCRINIYLFKKMVNFEYVSLGDEKILIQPNEIAIHFRSVIKTGTDNRSNFLNENADRLVHELFLLGFTVNVIGHPEFSYCPNMYCTDFRSKDIIYAINTIKKSIITIGQLSGPIHLAHLCKRPVLTWADDISRFKTVEMWNPFNQECLVVSHETFNPKTDEIIKKLYDYKNK